MHKSIELIPSYPVSFVESTTQLETEADPSHRVIHVDNIATNYLAVNTQQALRRSDGMNAPNSNVNNNSNDSTYGNKETNRMAVSSKSSALASHIHATHE